MVNPVSHYPSQGKRFSPRGGGNPYYGGLVDRKAAHNLHSAEQQAEVGLLEREANENQPQRKRISLACSRCRKRKIRCSGDEGNGQACFNCKSSSKEHECHFLRVGAISRPQFEYNVVACRKNEPRVPTALHSMPIAAPNMYPENMLIPTTEPSIYRGGAHYAVGPRYVYPMGSWAPGEYPHDDGVEYTVCQPSYTQQLNGPEPQYMMPYRVMPASASRQLMQPPSYPDTSVPFACAPENVSAAPLMMRSSNQDGYPIGGPIAHSIETMPEGNESLSQALSHRSYTSCGPSNCRAGSLSSAYSKSSQTTTTTTTTTASMSDTASPSSSVHDLSTTYTGYESLSPLSAYPMSVTSAAQSHIAPDGDLYTTSIPHTSVSGGSGSGSGGTEIVLRTSASVPELSYRYTDTMIRLPKSGSSDCLYAGMELARPYPLLRSQKTKVLSSPRITSLTASPEIKFKRSPSPETCGLSA